VDMLSFPRWGRWARRFLAVDFDTRQLRIVQAERSAGQVRLHRLIAVDVPEALDVSDAQGFGEFLARQRAELRLKETDVVMNVSRGQAVLKPLTLPATARQEELAEMVRFQVEKQLPFAPAEAVIDFTIESHYVAEDSPRTNPPGIEILAAAVRLPVLEYYKQIALSAGLRLSRLGLRPYATARCVRSWLGEFPPAKCLGVVHVTADEAEIHVLEDRSLAFSRSIVGRIAPGKKAGPELDSAVADVVKEVLRSLQSYQYRGSKRGARVEKVIFAGGTGIERRLAEAVQRRLKVACLLLHPPASLRLDLPEDCHASAFVAAIGLAAGQHDPREMPFDFVNPKRPPVQRDMRKVRAAVVAGGASLLLLIGAAARGVYLHGKDLELTRLTNVRSELRRRTRSYRQLERRVKALETWQRSRRDWLDHLANLSKLFPPSREAYVDALVTNSEGAKVCFTLFAKSQDVINELGRRLTEAGYRFHPEKVSTSGDGRYPYTVKVSVIVPAGLKVELSAGEGAKASETPGEVRR